MIFILTALKCEAEPIIDYYRLKHRPSSNVFNIYVNESTALIISGTGKIKSAAATAHILSRAPIKPETFIFNIGICGSNTARLKIGELCIINKISDSETGKNYYPDILINHSFHEASITTFPRPVYRSCGVTVKEQLVDMESSAFFEAASCFLGPHQIQCLKIPSDYMENKHMTGSHAAKLIKSNISDTSRFIKSACSIIEQKKDILTSSDIELVDKISKDMKLTKTQRYQLINYAKQYKIRTKNSIEWIKEFAELEIKQKHKRNIEFDKLKHVLSRYD